MFKLNYLKTVQKLCVPAKIYLGISALVIISILLQNIMNSFNIYTLGTASYRVLNTPIIFIIKVVYVVFWTWVLQLICKAGYTNLSWILVLLPIVMGLFTLYASLEGMAQNAALEGMCVKPIRKKTVANRL